MGGGPRLDRLAPGPQDLRRAAAADQERGGARGGPPHRRDPILAAGDSLLDADLLLAADRGWRPGHGELADSGWAAGHVTALTEEGVAAGERILREMLGVAGAGAAVGAAGSSGS